MQPSYSTKASENVSVETDYGERAEVAIEEADDGRRLNRGS